MSVPFPFATCGDTARRGPTGLQPPPMHPMAPAAPCPVLSRHRVHSSLPGLGMLGTLRDSRHLLSLHYPLTQPLLHTRDLQEAAVLSNIRTRFERQLIYVSLGVHGIPQRPRVWGLHGGSSLSECSQPQTSLSCRPT